MRFWNAPQVNNRLGVDSVGPCLPWWRILNISCREMMQMCCMYVFVKWHKHHRCLSNGTLGLEVWQYHYAIFRSFAHDTDILFQSPTELATLTPLYTPFVVQAYGVPDYVMGVFVMGRYVEYCVHMKKIMWPCLHVEMSLFATGTWNRVIFFRVSI